jgi:hypothetical protein
LPAAYAQYLKLRCLVASFSHQSLWFLIIFEQENLLDDDSIPEDARKHCIIGHARILAYVKDRIVDALGPPLVLSSKACSSRKCEVNSWKTIKTLPVWRTVESMTYGIFDCSEIEVTENTCSRCRSEVKKLTETVRSEFWSALPTFFGLPAWADLKDWVYLLCMFSSIIVMAFSWYRIDQSIFIWPGDRGRVWMTVIILCRSGSQCLGIFGRGPLDTACLRHRRPISCPSLSII